VLIIKKNEAEGMFPENILKTIKYIDEHHNKIEFGSFICPETLLKVIKLKYQTTPTSDSYVYEAHRLVDDIHYIKEGSESISIVDRESSKSESPYNHELDYELFRSNKSCFSQINADEIVVFSKDELHLTGIHSDINEVVKYVIKQPS